MCACVWGGWKRAAKFKRYKDRNGHRDCESPANRSRFTLHLTSVFNAVTLVVNQRSMQ